MCILKIYILHIISKNNNMFVYFKLVIHFTLNFYLFYQIIIIYKKICVLLRAIVILHRIIIRARIYFLLGNKSFCTYVSEVFDTIGIFQTALY